MKNTIKNLAIFFVVTLLIPTAVVFAATSINTDPQDYATLRVNNDTVNPNNPNTWAPQVNANPGEKVSFAIYYHNTGNEGAQNLRVTLSPQSTGTQRTHTFTATVRADNSNTVTGQATVTVNGSESLSFIPSSVIWRPNQTVFGSQALPNGQSGNEIFNGNGLSLGTIAPGWNTQGSVVLAFRVSGTGTSQNPPNVDISASPTTVSSGNSTFLTWTVTGGTATSCNASGDWSGSKNTNGGNETRSSIFSTKTYSITCTGPGGSDTDSVTVFVDEDKEIFLSFTASPSTITRGNQSLLTWGATNADHCFASGAWSGEKDISGNQYAYPDSTRTYTLRCENDSRDITKSVTVYVNENGSYYGNRPTVDIYASPQTVSRNQYATLYWNSNNADYCTATGGWSGAKSRSGSESVYPGTYGTTYSIVCYNNSGSETDSTYVSVYDQYSYGNYYTPYYGGTTYYGNVTVSLSANPLSVNRGYASTLTWSSTNANSCYASGGWSGTKLTAGTEVVYPQQTNTYTVTCTGPQNSQQASQTIYVGDSVQYQTQGLVAACAASPESPKTGDAVTFIGNTSGSAIFPVTYEWSGAVSGGGQTKGTTFSTIGTKTAYLTVRDAGGKSAQATCSAYVSARTVTQAPVKPVTPAKPVIAIVGEPQCRVVEICTDDSGKNYYVAKELDPTASPTVVESDDNKNGNQTLLASLFVTDNGKLSWFGILFVLLFFGLLFALGMMVATRKKGNGTSY